VTGCAHVRPELGGYVLDALEPAEAEAVREHLAHCADCAAEHAQLAGLPRLLALAEGAEDAAPLPPAVEERVLDAVARERRPARQARRLPRRPVLVGLAATLAAALVALAVVLGRDDGTPAGYRLALHPVAGQPATGRAELQSTPGGTAVHLWVRGLPADPKAVYEVRCDAPGWSASAGTFRADAHGRAVVVLTTAARRGEYEALRVVRRSAGSTTDILTAQL
jgi:hypothetical protein